MVTCYLTIKSARCEATTGVSYIRHYHIPESILVTSLSIEIAETGLSHIKGELKAKKYVFFIYTLDHAQ